MVKPPADTPSQRRRSTETKQVKHAAASAPVHSATAPVKNAALQAAGKATDEARTATIAPPGASPVSNQSTAADRPAPERGSAPDTRSADAMLGQVVWLMTHTPALKHAFLTDLEWMVLPPILLGQCRMMHQNGRPVAFAAWASVSEEVEKRIEQLNMKLAPAEWRSGDRVWLVNIIAPFGHAEKMFEELKSNALAGKAFKYHRRQADATNVVEVVKET